MFTHQLKKGVSGTDSQLTHNLQKITYTERDKECLFVCRVLNKQWGPGPCLACRGITTNNTNS